MTDRLGSDRMWDSGFKQTPGSRSTGRTHHGIENLRSIARMYVHQKISHMAAFEWILDYTRKYCDDPSFTTEQKHQVIEYADKLNDAFSLVMIQTEEAHENITRRDVEHFLEETGFQ